MSQVCLETIIRLTYWSWMSARFVPYVQKPLAWIRAITQKKPKESGDQTGFAVQDTETAYFIIIWFNWFGEPIYWFCFPIIRTEVSVPYFNKQNVSLERIQGGGGEGGFDLTPFLLLWKSNKQTHKFKPPLTEPWIRPILRFSDESWKFYRYKGNFTPLKLQKAGRDSECTNVTHGRQKVFIP